MTNSSELCNKQFEIYWMILARDICDIYIKCEITPSIEVFKEMLRSAYGMGWSQREDPKAGMLEEPQ